MRERRRAQVSLGDAAELLTSSQKRWAPHLQEALANVIFERHKQEVQHGRRSIALPAGETSLASALAKVVEEVGELAAGINNLELARHPDERNAILENIEYEAVQVAAVACAIVERMLGRQT
jgi:NTP pyrophosphatase (non-canonical NTP hydrolase)